MTLEEETVVRDITNARRYGRVAVSFAPRSALVDADALHAVDQFVSAHGFRPLQQAWIELQPEETTTRLTRMLAFDLAYDAQNMEWQLAQELTRRFLNLFESDVRLFTNSGPDVLGRARSRSRPWEPLSDATFDEGVVAVDAIRIGFVIVMDED